MRKKQYKIYRFSHNKIGRKIGESDTLQGAEKMSIAKTGFHRIILNTLTGGVTIYHNN